MPDDAQLLDDLITKLREMQDQLSLAQMEAKPYTLLSSRIRHLTILATHVRIGLQKIRQAAQLPAAKADGEGLSDDRNGG